MYGLYFILNSLPLYVSNPIEFNAFGLGFIVPASETCPWNAVGGDPVTEAAFPSGRQRRQPDPQSLLLSPWAMAAQPLAVPQALSQLLYVGQREGCRASKKALS